MEKESKNGEEERKKDKERSWDVLHVRTDATQEM